MTERQSQEGWDLESAKAWARRKGFKEKTFEEFVVFVEVVKSCPVNAMDLEVGKKKKKDVHAYIISAGKHVRDTSISFFVTRLPCRVQHAWTKELSVPSIKLFSKASLWP
jgi:hypothetical protein